MIPVIKKCIGKIPKPKNNPLEEKYRRILGRLMSKKGADGLSHWLSVWVHIETTRMVLKHQTRALPQAQLSAMGREYQAG